MMVWMMKRVVVIFQFVTWQGGQGRICLSETQESYAMEVWWVSEFTSLLEGGM